MTALRKFNAKRDANEGEIVEAFRTLGCLVQRLDQPVDLLIYVYQTRRGYGKLLLVEVKIPGASLNENQSRFVADGWPVRVVRSVDEAIALVKSLREAA